MVDTKGMAFGCICVCAVRYACGRQTYMPSIVKRFVHDNLKEIETSSLKVMSKDLAEMPGYGDRKNRRTRLASAGGRNQRGTDAA